MPGRSAWSRWSSSLAVSFSVIFVLGGFSTLAADSKDDKKSAPAGTKEAVAYKNVDVAAFEKLRADKKVVVLDVRTKQEFDTGHIPGSILLDWNSGEFEAKISKLDTNKTYLVHCAAGRRSAKACDKMSQLKFGKVYNLEGGFTAWEKAGNKAEK